MDIISKDIVIDLIERCEGKAVSIYMPTFVSAREVRQNSIRLKSLIKEVKSHLSEAMDEASLKSYLTPLTDLVEDEIFWQEQDEGLALFLDANELTLLKLPINFEETVVVGNAFYITPLIPLYQGNGEYYLLSVDQQRPKIYQGSKFRLMRVEELDLPESLQNMFDQYYEFHSHLQFHTSTNTPNPDRPGDREGMFFGHGGDDVDINAERRNFFHRFDEALMDYLGKEDIPLVLAGVGFLHPIYKEANTYPNLVDEGITKDVDHMPIEDLHEKAWDIVKHKYHTDVEQALNVYKNLKDKSGDVTENIKEIVSAAYFKRIHTLFVSENEHVWGEFDPDENEVILDDKQNITNDDLLGTAAAQTLVYGGNVLVLSPEEVPGNQQAAAILRY